MKGECFIEYNSEEYRFSDREAALRWLIDLGVEGDETLNVEDQIRAACRWLDFRYVPGSGGIRSPSIQQREGEHIALSGD